MMNRSRLNLFLDTLSFLVFVTLIATGFVMRFILPPGSGGRGRGGAVTLWGWSRHDWGDVHFWLSLSLVVLMLLHLALHWRWVCNVIGQGFARGTPTNCEPATRASARVYGSGVLLCIAAIASSLFWWGWQSAGSQEGRAAGEHGRGWRGGRVTTPAPDEKQATLLSDADTSPRRIEASPRSTAAAPTAPTPSDSTAATCGQAASTHGDDHLAGELAQIRGSMTLDEIERATGVSAARILRELRLPANTPTNERLGRLRQTHGFEMERVREIVEWCRSSRPLPASPHPG